MMSKSRRIYLLSPKKLNAETIAVTFAKTSRSPKSFDVIADELTDEKSAQFHEKWVVGYGHASVAEHAVLHLALENVSRLAIETIEGNRLASYTEKSTRYQTWDADAFYLPSELTVNSLQSDYVLTCEFLFSAYADCLEQVQTWMRTQQPRQKDEKETAYSRRIRSSSVDICRFLLPAASLANVGVTINARALEYALCKLLSSPLEEVRSIGEGIKHVARLETPTLIKYAGENAYLQQTRQFMNKLHQQELTGPHPSDWDWMLLSADTDGEKRVLAALMQRFGDFSFETCYERIQSLSEPEVKSLIAQLMALKGRFDQPLREFEYAQLTFEAIMDQGAYFEFKRHRMMTQTVQPLSTSLGFAIPRGITESGCEDLYLTAMRKAAACYQEIENEIGQAAAAYIVPNAYNRRVLFTLNLREVFHLCRLRAAENAHFSIRRVAYKLAESVCSIYPHLGSYLPLPTDATWQKIEAHHFTSLHAF
jgi:thymidylate synthase ThyX